MRKKKIKKEKPFLLYLEELKRWNEMSDKEKNKKIRQRIIKSNEKNKRHAKYSEQPLRSVRGLSKVRGVLWGGPQNGMLCMACLRRGIDSQEMCKYCKSTNLIGINSKARLPNRTASRGQWKRFIRNHTAFKMKEFPRDFLKNINKKVTDG